MKLAHGAAVAAAALVSIGLSGCGNSDNSTTPNAQSTGSASSSVTSTTSAPATKLVGTSAAPLPSPSPTHPAAAAPAALSDLDCGQITGTNGASANVIAFATAAGRAGCSDAITVTSDYIGIPRTGDAATVDGWTCEPQPDTTIPHVCSNNGVIVGLRGAAAPATLPAPAPTPIHLPDPARTPQSAGLTEPSAPAPAAAVADVNCGPVTDAGCSTRHVIAVGTAAGRVGCTEAITVATTYATTVAPSDVVSVDGWACEAQPDAVVPSICVKDALQIALRAS